MTLPERRAQTRRRWMIANRGVRCPRNVLIAAIVLYVTAISSVRGFALSLGVATALDLFVVYFFKRPVVFLIARSERLVNLRGFGLTSATASAPLPGESS